MNTNHELNKGEMVGVSKHSFIVVNLTKSPLTGKVSWDNGENEVSIDVTGLPAGQASKSADFFPSGGHNDMWHWNKKGRKYQLNCYSNDIYAVVTVSEYGFGVLVTATSPDTWAW